MAVTIPYMSSAGSINKILEKIKDAGTPDTFNSDFLATKLGFKGGNNRTFIPWAKKCKLLTGDGSPTLLYKKFRNPTSSKSAVAEAIREGYAELYSRNEYCHELNKSDFKGLVMEATGQAQDSKVVEYIVNTFFNVKTFADFDSEPAVDEMKEERKQEQKKDEEAPSNRAKKIAIGLNYTINLVLPKTDDPAVYNAIFKTLRENLLND